MMKACQSSSKETFFSKKKRSQTMPLKNQFKSSYSLSQATHPQIRNGHCSEMCKRRKTGKSIPSRSFRLKMTENILTNTTCTCLWRHKLHSSFQGGKIKVCSNVFFYNFSMHYQTMRKGSFIWSKSLFSIYWLTSLGTWKRKTHWPSIESGFWLERNRSSKQRFKRLSSFSIQEASSYEKMSIWRWRTLWYAGTGMEAKF